MCKKITAIPRTVRLYKALAENYPCNDFFFTHLFFVKSLHRVIHVFYVKLGITYTDTM